jgi:hypothetical protein
MAVRGKQSPVHIEQGTCHMLHKCALALIAAMLVATPALAIDTRPPTALGPQTASTLRPPANVPSTTGAKANAATVAKKPNQHVAAQQTTKKAKHAKPTKANSKVAKSKTHNSTIGASNDQNSNHANSKQKKMSKARSRPVENRTPADITGSVPPRSLLPALY